MIEWAYVLTKTEPRAETTDTIIYFVADDKAELEEIILSLYNEIMDNKINYPNIPDEIFNARVKDYMRKFTIVKVPYLKH